jgi:hypothetical protein
MEEALVIGVTALLGVIGVGLGVFVLAVDRLIGSRTR